MVGQPPGICNGRGSLKKILVQRKTREEWERTVYDMIGRGAQIFPDEAEEIIKYLSQNFGPNRPVN